MTNSVNIPHYICKYLESIDLVKKFSTNTLRAYSSDLLQLFQLSEFVEIQRVSRDEAIRYQYHCTNEKNINFEETVCGWKQVIEQQLRKWAITNRSKKRKLSALRQFLVFLFEEHGIKIDLALEAPRGIERKLPHFLSVDETMALAQFCDQAAPESSAHCQQALLFYLLYGGGLRVSEACSIELTQVNTSQGTLKIKGKGNRERLAVLPSKVFSAIQTWGSTTGPYLWGEKPLPTRTAYSRIQKLGVEAGLFKPLHPHALRHSYATQLLNSGSDLRIIQQLLGHKSLAATEIYTHLDINDLARTMNRFHPLK